MDAAVIERFFVAVHVSQMDVAAGIFRAHFNGLKAKGDFFFGDVNG
jgi:hypothetical protein